MVVTTISSFQMFPTPQIYSLHDCQESSYSYLVKPSHYSDQNQAKTPHLIESKFKSSQWLTASSTLLCLALLIPSHFPLSHSSSFSHTEPLLLNHKRHTPALRSLLSLLPSPGTLPPLYRPACQCGFSFKNLLKSHFLTGTYSGSLIQ